MKAVLLVLSGDHVHARERLRALAPEAEIEILSRAEVESSSYVARLKALRARRPDVFAISTERLAWQRGQNALALFGALAGAKTVLLFDSHGGMREESGAKLLLRAPA